MEQNLTVSYNPDFFWVSKWEKNFNGTDIRKWLDENTSFLWYCVAAYLILIFGGEMYMKAKNSFNLTPVLLFWNLLLCLFSVAAAVRSWTEMYYVLRTFGFNYSICNMEDALQNSVSNLWALLFMFSKLLEYGDTAFIILKKRKLIILHWFHHLTISILSWFAYVKMLAVGRWAMLLNASVHSFMYLYYALTTIKIKIPRLVTMALTIVQITQITFGIFLIFFTYHLKPIEECSSHTTLIFLSIIIGVIYIILFCNFFYHSYYVRVNDAPLKLAKLN